MSWYYLFKDKVKGLKISSDMAFNQLVLLIVFLLLLILFINI